MSGCGWCLSHFLIAWTQKCILGTPHSGTFLLFFIRRGPQGARFRTQGPPNQKKVGPEPARLAKWKQIWSKYVPKSNLKTWKKIAAENDHKLLQIGGRSSKLYTYMYKYIYGLVPNRLRNHRRAVSPALCWSKLLWGPSYANDLT